MISPGVREETTESELHSWHMCQLYKISEAKEDTHYKLLFTGRNFWNQFIYLYHE